MKCKLRPSKHAKDQMIVRGISKEEIFESIQRGPKRISEEKIMVLYKGFEIAYRQFPCNYFLITVYWKR